MAVLRHSALLIAALLGFLLALPLALAAQGTPSDPVDRLDPALVRQALGGDPNAAYNAGIALLTPWQEDNLRAALPFLDRAFEGANASPDNLYLSTISALMLGRVHVGLSDYRKGLAYSKQAEAIARSLIDTPNAPDLVVTAMEDQSTALIALSQYADALTILDLLLEYQQSQDPPNAAGMASVNWSKGMAHEGLSQFDSALNAYAASFAYYRETEGDTSEAVAGLANNIGWVQHRMGKYAESEKWFLLALPTLEKHQGKFAENTGKNYINIGLAVFELGRPDDAIRWAMKAMPFIAANPTQTLSDQRWNFELLARAFAAKGQPERAIFFGKMAVNAQQAIRATNTTGNREDNAELQAEWRRLYQLLADLLITQGRISEAQAVLNMEKEEEVFKYLRRDAKADLIKTRATLTDSELSEEARLAALSALPIAADQELRTLMAKLEEGNLSEEEENQIFLLQDALQQAADKFDADVAAFLAASETSVREKLEPQFDAIGSYQEILADLGRPTAILQIATLDEAVHLFLTLPGVTQHQKTDIARADLARLVFDALQAIETTAPDASEKLRALHDILFAPVSQAIQDSGTEVIMLNLDSFLRYVPFAALYDGQNYLVESYAFSLYSAAVPTQFEAPARSGAKTAGFGVTAAHPGFSPLPGVKRELETIFGESGVLDGQTALDAGFDERSLKKSLLRKPAILHIASHFNLEPGQEDDSFLLLGDGAHLPLSKIRSTRALRFQGVDLLTLSACQTARGGDGAEIDGFGATAQLNGAGAVMASLWPVSDAATPRLMHSFYHGMMAGGLDKAEALRQAQIAMLHSNDTSTDTENRAAAALDDPSPAAPVGFEHPYFWSAFVLMGNWL